MPQKSKNPCLGKGGGGGQTPTPSNTPPNSPTKSLTRTVRQLAADDQVRVVVEKAFD